METEVRTTVDEVLGCVAELEPMIRAASAEGDRAAALGPRGRGAAGRGVLLPVPAAEPGRPVVRGRAPI